MKVEDPKKRRRLAEQVARGELTLIKLRDKIEGRRPRAAVPFDEGIADSGGGTGDETDAPDETADASWTTEETVSARPLTDDSLVNAKQGLVEAVDELIGVLGDPEVRGAIGVTDRVNLAKYLTIAKLRLENAIAMVRSDDAGY